MGKFKDILTARQEARHQQAQTANDGLLRDVDWDVEILHPASLPPLGIRRYEIEGER